MKKKIAQALIAVTLISCMAGMSPAFAASETPAVTTETEADVVIQRADQFETHYRTLNGVLQYRIWNCTKGIWTMPWTNCQ